VTIQVAKRSPNMAGLVDSCMDWVFMAEVMSNVPEIRPGFTLSPATDYMVPPAVIGATGAFSALSAIAPKLVRTVYDLCAKQQFTQARKAQEDIAALSHLLKTHGFPGLKGALRAMGRDCGPTRPPVRDLTADQNEKLAKALRALPFLEAESRGW
jgi:dihydrodipicolinate synthase/N-acetylneuraminate lyase